jgi:hypothetical protein
MYLRYVFLYVFGCLCSTVASAKERKVMVRYPVVLMPPVLGSSFTGTAQRDVLICFGNRLLSLSAMRMYRSVYVYACVFGYCLYVCTHHTHI